ncbi:MAG: RHS repeat-associated core domain-containing protein, partial [Gammaproteobacteria bacterium]
MESEGDLDQVERSYAYRYVNARMNVSGHGWLGFDRKVVIESSTIDPGRTITTDFVAPVRYTLSGQILQDASVPYAYPIAGMPMRIIIDENASGAFGPGLLENAVYDRRTVIENLWNAQTSASGLSFPRIASRLTQSFERERPSGFPDPRSFEDHGLLRSRCQEFFTFDGYGNVTDIVEECQRSLDPLQIIERNSSQRAFLPNPGTWLISNLQSDLVISERSGNHREQLWDLSYDSRGLLASIRRVPVGAQEHTTTYVRDSFGNVTDVIESTPGQPSRTTTVVYDADKVFPLALTNAQGHTSQIRMDPRWGAPKTMADPNGIAVQHAYDGLGLRTETRDPQGTTVYGYTQSRSAVDTGAGPIHPRIAVSIEREGVNGTPGGRSVQEYDYLGRPVRSRTQSFGGAEVVQEQAYDFLGRPIGFTLPHTADTATPPTVAYFYDHLDRITSIRNPDGTFRDRHYASGVTLAPEYRQWLATPLVSSGVRRMPCLDTDGEDYEGPVEHCAVDIELEVDEEGHENAIISDHRGNIVRSIDGENVDTGRRTSEYRYGAFNRLIETRDNRDFVTAFEYDAFGRLLRHTDPDSGDTVYTYTGYDELRTSLDPKGQLRTYNRDQLGRLTSIVDPAGTTQWIYDQGVNALGRISETVSPGTAENPAGQRVIYTYEAPTAANNRGLLERLDYLIDGVDYRITMGYDDLGRTERVDYPDLGHGDPIVAKYHYDSSGALTGLDEIGSGEAKPLWRLDETFQGHLTKRETFGNGASTSYGYNPDRYFLTSMTTTRSSQLVHFRGYTHYANGQVDVSLTASTSRQHLYDAMGRLVATVNTTNGNLVGGYDYDDIGNITARSFTEITYKENRPHLVDTVEFSQGVHTYVHDANGNVEQRSGPDVPGGIQTFQYTPFDLPKQIITGQAGVEKTTRFEYSATEERLVRRDNLKTRHFVTDLYQRVFDNATADTDEERFFLYLGDRQLGEIVREDGTDQTLYFHTDNLGSVVTISNDLGETFEQNFEDFGFPLQSSQSAPVTRFGFTGHQHDRDLGLIDMRGRIYDPMIAQFTSADPITQAPFWSQGLNRYAYAFNDPVNVTDPSG